MVDDEWDGRNLRGKKPSETELGWLGWWMKFGCKRLEPLDWTGVVKAWNFRLELDGESWDDVMGSRK